MTAKRASDVEHGRRVIDVEIKALRQLARRLDNSFTRAVRLTADCAGRVVVTGMGKAGIIAQKVSATLASTGTPSYYIHPAEAVHGDLGRIVPEDVVLAFSNSGETQELIRLLPGIRRIGENLIGVTG